MDPAIARAPMPVAFEDGLGERRHTVDPRNEPLEALTLRSELTAVPSFEFALRERVSRLASFRHACYGHVRGVERIDRGTPTLAIVSDRVPGVRLSEVLAVAEKELLPVEIDAGLCLIRQLVQAVAMLHEQLPDVCHGAISPERVIITPNARLVIVEHVLGAALGQLLYSRERYWKELRIPLPPRAGLPRFDRRADVTQVGAIALALILGRPLNDDDYPARMEEIVGRVGAVSASGGLEPLPASVRSWLSRALQLDPRASFASAVEALAELDNVLGETDYTAAPSALEGFLAQYYASVELSASEPVPQAAPVVAPPIAVAPAAAPAAVTSKAAAPKIAGPNATALNASALNAAAPSPANRAHLANKPQAAASRPADDVSVVLRAQMEEAEIHMPKPTASRRRLIAAAVVLLALTSGGALAARNYLMPSAAAATGTLAVSTNPEGVGVVVDGKPRGLTPLSLSLPAGDHVLELVTEDQRRKIPVKITAGGQVSQFIEMPKASPGVGRLLVRTEPSGAKVSVDGHVFGRSPLTVEGLTPGAHSVLLETELASVKQEVTVEAGTTASLVVPLSAPQGMPVSGWIAVNAPVDVQLFEGGRLLGSSRSDRIMVSVGRHELEVVNDALGYRSTHNIQVTPGQVANVRLDWPKGTIALNALPWADVFIDGKLIGETPIGSVAVPIGAHEVTFRHPELGEHRSNIVVTLGTPAKLSVDLRKK